MACGCHQVQAQWVKKKTLSFGNLVVAVLKLSLSQPSKISDMSEMHDNITTPHKMEIWPNSKISHVAQILGQKMYLNLTVTQPKIVSMWNILPAHIRFFSKAHPAPRALPRSTSRLSHADAAK